MKLTALLIGTALFMAQGSPPAQTNQTKKIRLRVSTCCSGMCGDAGNKVSFILYEDNSAEAVVSRGWCFYDEDKSVVRRKNITLTQDEVEDLIRQIESQEFMQAKEE